MKKPEFIKNKTFVNVSSRETAWKMIDLIFETDYQQDAVLSKKASYPIFRSTTEGEYSTISDLGSMIVIEFRDGGKISKKLNSFTILID